MFYICSTVTPEACLSAPLALAQVLALFQCARIPPAAQGGLMLGYVEDMVLFH